MERHEYSALFPDMGADEFAALVSSIRSVGFDPLMPITLYEGQILDGWHRYRACKELGVAPITQTLEGAPEEALDFAVRANGARRSLTTGQKAYLACDLIPVYAKFAKERKLATLKKGSAPLAQQCANGVGSKSSEDVAGKFGVGARSVEQMQKLRKENTPLAQEVRGGKISLSAAYDQHIALLAKRQAAIDKALEEQRRLDEQQRAEQFREAARKKSQEAAEAERQRKIAEQEEREREAEVREKQRRAEQAKTEEAKSRLRKEAAEAEQKRRAAQDKMAAEQAKKKEAEQHAEHYRRLRAQEEQAKHAKAREEEEKAWQDRDRQTEKYMREYQEARTGLFLMLSIYKREDKLDRIPGVLKDIESEIQNMNTLHRTQKRERLIIDV